METRYRSLVHSSTRGTRILNIALVFSLFCRTVLTGLSFHEVCPSTSEMKVERVAQRVHVEINVALWMSDCE